MRMSRFLLIVGVAATACVTVVGALNVLLALVRSDGSLEGFMRLRSWRRGLRTVLLVTVGIAFIGLIGHWNRADIDACIEDARGNKAEIEECRS